MWYRDRECLRQRDHFIDIAFLAVFQAENMIFRCQDHRQFLRGISIEKILVGETVIHACYHFDLFQHQLNGLFLGQHRIALAARVGVKR